MFRLSLLISLFVATTQAFQAPQPVRWPSALSLATADGVLGASSIITPEGYGFSAPARRILSESGRSDGYYKAYGKELVIDVMEAITQGVGPDVALIYDDQDQLKGIFTESDYIKVRGKEVNGCHTEAVQ